MQHLHSSCPVTRNLLITLQYDGSRYHGWQVQKNAVSVQSVFQRQLEALLGGTHDIKGCSRTDTGVHAQEYCVSVKTNSSIPAQRIPAALNNLLPKDISVTACREVPLDFHARYSCVGKEYRYLIWNAPSRNPFWENRAFHYRYRLDENQLNQAALYYVGKQDFSAFCSTKSDQDDTVRQVTAASVIRSGDLIVFQTRADGFLYNMVRIMVGTLLRVAEGRFAVSDIPAILSSGDRRRAGPTAPPQGLYLTHVFYDPSDLHLHS